MLELYTIAGGVILAYMSLLYAYSILIKDAGIVDIAWGPGFAMLAVISVFYYTSNYSLVKVLVCGMVVLWGVRLGLHIGLRKMNKSEDWRYAKWRKEWGKSFNVRSFLQIFILQGILILAIAAPVVVASNDKLENTSLNILQITGALIWLAGLSFEVIADKQLAKFIKTKKKNQVLQTGLWKYSRHPNYFGEVTLWWGLWLVVLPLAGGVAAIISPLLVTVLILFVSGVPMLEKKYKTVPAFKTYAQKTSVFIPLPTKKAAK